LIGVGDESSGQASTPVSLGQVGFS